jgi:hypothetical protein
MVLTCFGRHAGIAAALCVAVSILCGCSRSIPATIGAASSQRPVASIQELMQGIIDPSADGIWNAVETIETSTGSEVRQPRTPKEWLEVRHAALTLVESGNLLILEGRAVGARAFAAEAAGALDSTDIQKLIGAKRAMFDAYAAALREAGVNAISAIDARNPASLIQAGGVIDQVCEGCHLTFWYPNQAIPAFPRDGDPHHPVFKAGERPR